MDGEEKLTEIIKEGKSKLPDERRASWADSSERVPPNEVVDSFHAFGLLFSPSLRLPVPVIPVKEGLRDHTLLLLGQSIIVSRINGYSQRGIDAAQNIGDCHKLL